MATLEQIQAKLKKLQAQAEVMLAKKSQSAIDQIRALMLEHGLTTADLEAKAKSKRDGRGLAAAAADSGKVAHVTKAKGAPKYQNPKTGATWSGFGRAPSWIVDAKDRNKFLIASEDTVAVSETAKVLKSARTRSTAAARSVTKQGQPKGPQPALYRDPKSGATWSGRGRAPSWIGSNRAKFLIVDAVDGGKETGTGVSIKPKVAKVAKAVAVKGATKKAVAKSAAATKVAKTSKATSEKALAKESIAPAAKRTVVRKAAERKINAKKAALVAETAAVPEVPVSAPVI
jgi:DNA-binding protein H-NS